MQTTGFKSSASMKFGDRLFGTLAGLRAAYPDLLAGIILALVYASWPSIRPFGIGFLFSDAWNPPMEGLRWPDPDLRHARHLGCKVNVFLMSLSLLFVEIMSYTICVFA